MCNQSTYSNLWNCIRRTYLTIKNHQRKFYKILTSWRIQDTKTKLDGKKQCFYIPVKFLVTHEYKKTKPWHANMYMISQKNYNHLLPQNICEKQKKIKKISYPRKGTCVCKHLFITCPAVFSKIEYTLCVRKCNKKGVSPLSFSRYLTSKTSILHHFRPDVIMAFYRKRTFFGLPSCIKTFIPIKRVITFLSKTNTVWLDDSYGSMIAVYIKAKT